MKKTFIFAAFICAVVSITSCDMIGGNDMSYKTTEEEKYSLEDFNIKGAVSRTVTTTYNEFDVATSVLTQDFDESGRVSKAEDEDLVSGEKVVYKFSFDKKGNIKSVKVNANGNKFEMKYKYDKKNLLRECQTEKDGETGTVEMMWYDANGFPVKQLSSNNSGKYWAFNYDASGKMLSKASYLNDGSGTLVLNYVYSDFEGNKWTHMKSFDDEGNVYGEDRCEYNGYGDMVSLNCKANMTSFSSNATIDYEYDSHGNWVKMIHTSTLNGGTPTIVKRTRELKYR